MYFTVEKIYKQLDEIRQAVYRSIQPIPSFKFIEADPDGAQHPDFDDSDWKAFTVGDTWGGYDVDAWFRARVPIPAGWRDKKLHLRFLVGPRDGGDSTAETMLYVNGTPLQAIDIWHEEAWLPPEQLQSDEVFIALKAWSGVLGVPDRRRFKLAQLIWIDEATERFYYLSDTLLKTLKELDENDLRRVQLLQAIDNAYLKLDFTKPQSEAFYQSVQRAYESLQGQVEAWQAVAETKPRVLGVGHAHIDMAWLWRLSHSREKAARSFTTVLHYMRQYPEYRFIHSSPQLYKFLKEDYPDIFARVKEKIATGQWEITGGMWIESDTNVPSGESLIRQFLLGRRYIQQEFGQDSQLLWMPDVFGYSWALPQIAVKSGIKYFLTSKISWSQYNRFPYDTFTWRGIDGTELLTHFVTTPERDSHFYTYNGEMRPQDVKGIWDNYNQKEVNDELLILFGWGDGGGGPTQQMIESARVMKNLPGLPEVAQDQPEAYFARLQERVADQKLPRWDGELYLEYHRGTYTSQAQVKRANRLSEVLYHNAEWLNGLARILTGQHEYPSEQLQEGWEMILLNQFHDILPGSSIRQVYEDAELDYARVREIGETAVAQAHATLEEQIQCEQDCLLVYNPLSWQRGDLVSLPWSEPVEGKSIAGESGQPLPSQVVEQDGQKQLLLPVKDVPSLGYRTYPLVDGQETAASQLTVTPTLLENPYYRLELNEKGQLTSIWDKQNGRQVLASGARGNVLQAFQDKPMAFDAWDIDIYYQDIMREIDDLVEVAVEETGPLRGVLRLQWRYYDSTITQRLTIYQASPRIDFRTEIDWQEGQTLLKAAFPVNVRATRATYDIQFGQIERPTHWNTSWDYARFEVPAHKWADLSEGNYGVALLNDCKYGYDIKDNVMRLTLLKSAIRPDAMADKGKHLFTYSLLPHAGEWRDSSLLQEGYTLNNPLLTKLLPANPAGSLAGAFEFASLDTENVILETVKKAEDEDAWILRLYESKQHRCDKVTLRFGRPVSRVVACNLMEEEEQAVDHTSESLTFAIAPYEILTYKVWF